MNKIIDYAIEDSQITNNKIIINSPVKDSNINNKLIIKCYKNYSNVSECKADNSNIIKITKSFWLNFLYLTHINLSNNLLLKFPKYIFTLKQVKYLNLDNNKIKTIPSYIANFIQLEILSINNNEIDLLPNSLIRMKHLTILKVSFNKITSLPIEIGLIKPLVSLHIIGNRIKELPTTLCNLSNLKDIQFEWINLLINSKNNNLMNTPLEIYKKTFELFKSLLTNKILYCDFFKFINAHIKSNITDKTLLYSSFVYDSIDSNYYSIIQILLNYNRALISSNYSHKKSPIIHSLSQENREEIAKLIFDNINLKSLNQKEKINILSKAIKTTKLKMVISLCNNTSLFNLPNDYISDTGMTPFHFLFSSFNLNDALSRAIGDILFEKLDHKTINSYNNEHWGAIHVAARRSNIKCFEWIVEKNKLISSGQNAKHFLLSLRGKDNWTPLHLASNSGKVEITYLLLKNNADVLAKTMTYKTPRDVSNNNIQISKLLVLYENNFLFKKYVKPYIIIDNDKGIPTYRSKEGKKHGMLYTPSRANINFYKEIFSNKDSTMLEIAEAITNLTSTMLKPVTKKVTIEEYCTFVEKTLRELDLSKKNNKNYIIICGLSDISISINAVKVASVYENVIKKEQQKLCYTIKNEMKRTIKILYCINKIPQLPKPQNSLIMNPQNKKKKLNVINLKNYSTSKKENAEQINDSLDTDNIGTSPKSRNITHAMNISSDISVSSKFDIFHNNVPQKSNRTGFNITNESCNIQDSSASIIKADSIGVTNINLNK